MNPLDLNLVCEYVNTHISDFHARRLKTLAELRLETLLRRNPYLFRAKNIVTANELITGLLDAFLSSSSANHPEQSTRPNWSSSIATI